MSDTSRFSTDSISATVQLRLDQICNRFEDQLREGQHPVVEEFLAEAPETARATLLAELHSLESDYRHRQDSTAVVGGGGPELVENLDFLRPPERGDELGRLGEYRALEILGVGGMGIVFRAEDPRLGRHIALKVMKPVVARFPSAKERFLREARATAATEHDHIVAIYQVGEDRGIPFMAMQLLRGESLQARLLTQDRFEQREVMRIGREVATGLAAAHRQNLIHRDIKPANIWLEESTGRAKILDFGLVHLAVGDDNLTESGQVLGTLRYMAPEQAQGEEVDSRCDLFSLGCVLYQLLAGRAPFEGRNQTAVLIAIAQSNPKPLHLLRPEVHSELSRLVMQMLSKDPDQRPVSAAEVARQFADIERQMDTRPLSQLPAVASTSPKQAAQPGTQRSGWRWWGLGGALAVLLLAGVVGVWATGWFNADWNGRRSDPASKLPTARPIEREVAEWVLKEGGGIGIKPATKPAYLILPPEGLPREEFALTRISLGGHKSLTVENVRRLAQVDSLVELNLSDTGLTDEGLAQLTDLPNLICLNLVDARVTDAGLANLARIPSLTQLYISRCDIGDESIPTLRALNLDQLTLDGTRVTFGGLKQLAVDSKLSTLTVTDLKLSEDEVRQLHDLLPNCQIVSEYGAFEPELPK